MTTTLAALNSGTPAIQGPNVGLGDLLNQVITNMNAASTATAATDTVTIAGTAHAGDTVTITTNGQPDSYVSLGPGGVATGTVTIGGTLLAGDVVEVTIGGVLVAYSITSGDVSAGVNTAATSVKTAINANTTIANNFVASTTGSSGVITINALLPGTAGNVTLTAAVGGAGHTTTAVASGANLTGGSAGDTVTTIANALKAAINADPVTSLLVTATSALGVITLTAKLKGVGPNAYTLTAAVTGAGATVTATAGAATFGASTAGTGNTDVAKIF